MKSVKFVMHRDKTIASTMGLSLAFEKGVPMAVPPYMIQEVIAAGGVPESELTDEEVVALTSNEPTDKDERQAALFAAFEDMVLRNVREEFTAGGAPHTSVLTQKLGWSVQAKERDLAFAKFKAGQSD